MLAKTKKAKQNSGTFAIWETFAKSLSYDNLNPVTLLLTNIFIGSYQWPLPLGIKYAISVPSIF